MLGKCARSPGDLLPAKGSAVFAYLYHSPLTLYTLQCGLCDELACIKFRSARKAVAHAEQ
jgi:hypothetical protein